MPTLDYKAITFPLRKLENQHCEVVGEVQAPPKSTTYEPKCKKGVKKNLTFEDGMQEEPKPFGQVSIEVEEEELTRASSKGKSKKSHEGDVHITESPLKKKKKPTKTPIVQKLSISIKTRVAKVCVKEIKGMYLNQVQVIFPYYKLSSSLAISFRPFLKLFEIDVDCFYFKFFTIEILVLCWLPSDEILHFAH